MLRVSMEIPPSRASMVAQLFEAEGFRDVQWERPTEIRTSAAQELVHVVYHLGTDAVAGLVGKGAVQGVQRVIQRLRRGAPDLDVKVEEVPKVAEPSDDAPA